MKKLIVLLFLFLTAVLTVNVIRSEAEEKASVIDWSNFESEVDEAIKRAEARADSAFNMAEYLQTLDSFLLMRLLD